MEKVKLGKVVRLHGIVGEMKISTSFDKDFDVKTIETLYDKYDTEFKVKRAFKHDSGLIVGLEGVDINKARSFIGKDFFISREIVAGRILVEDIKGSEVYVEDGLIGKVYDVQDFGTAEVIYIKRADGNELLVPNVSGLIKNFNLSEKKLELSKTKLCEVSDYED